MSSRSLRFNKTLTAGLLAAVLAGACFAVVPRLKGRGHPPPPADAAALRAAERTRLAPDVPDALWVPEDTVESLGVRTTEVVVARQPRRLPPLPGSLTLDTNRLVHVHPRFPGEVVAVGRRDGNAPASRDEQQLGYGDRVEKGQLLAVLWSKELGEKKSELVDALSRLGLDQQTLERLRESFRKGALPERSLREAERNVEADQIAVARAERTLQAWRLSEDEIQAVREEARHVHELRGASRGAGEADWARVEVRAPAGGTILERNVALGDLVDPAIDLFKIADLSRLLVWAYAYEEDLPALQDLPRPIPWTVRLSADPAAPPLPGTVEKISSVIDPSQHTALLVGRVNNPQGRLRAGQFITATVELPPVPGEVTVPAEAVIRDGGEDVVFVQPNPREPVYALRRVAVARRDHAAVFVVSEPKPAPGRQRHDLLLPGEFVVSAGAVELKAALDDLQGRARGRADD